MQIHQGAKAVGIGLRPEHFLQAVKTGVSVDFVEVHSENFFAAGGMLKELLVELSQHVAVSLHGTSAGVGSAVAIPDDYLAKLKALVGATNPVLVSDHLCFAWGEVNGRLVHGGDLLPIPYTRESLRHAIANVDRLQQALGRQVAIENVCAYLDVGAGEFSEAEFLNELVAGTGCGLILDVNNVMVNARNAAEDDVGAALQRYLVDLDHEAVVEIHLAGATEVGPTETLIDDHACPVSELGWQCYRQTLQGIGPRPTLVEWDNNLPSLERLVAEADQARVLMQDIHAEGRVDVG